MHVFPHARCCNLQVQLAASSSASIIVRVSYEPDAKLHVLFNFPHHTSNIDSRVMMVKNICVHTYKASPRGWPTTPATLAQKGKVRQLMRRGQRSIIEYVFFNNAKGPAMLQGKTARTPHTLRVAGVFARYARSHAVRTYIPQVG